MARDVNSAESDWATLEVTMPKNKQYMPSSTTIIWLHLFHLLSKIIING